MSSNIAPAWAAPVASPPRRTRAAVARNPFRTLKGPLAENIKCWNKHPSHISQAANRTNRARGVKNRGGLGGQKRRAVWRNGKGGERLRSRLPGKTGQFARRDEVRKDAQGKWVYV